MAKRKKTKKPIWKKIKAGLLKRHPFAIAVTVIILCAALLAGFAPDSPLAINKPNYRVAVSISGPTSVTAGKNVKYTLKVKNTGKKTLKSAVGQFIPSSLVVSKPSGCVANASNLTCNIKNLGAGSTKSFSITLNYPNNPGNRKLTATAIAFGTPTSTDPTNTKYLFVNVKSKPNYALSASISGVPSKITLYKKYTYTISIANTGKKTLNSVTVRYWEGNFVPKLPSGFKRIPGPTGAAQEIRGSLTNFKAGATKRITLMVVYNDPRAVVPNNFGVARVIVTGSPGGYDKAEKYPKY